MKTPERKAFILADLNWRENTPKGRELRNLGYPLKDVQSGVGADKKTWVREKPYEYDIVEFIRPYEKE